MLIYFVALFSIREYVVYNLFAIYMYSLNIICSAILIFIVKIPDKYVEKKFVKFFEWEVSG